MKPQEFNQQLLQELKANGYKYIEINATGSEVESSVDYFRKEVLVIPHHEKPESSKHYVMSIEDDEVADIASGNDTDIFYLQYKDYVQ